MQQKTADFFLYGALVSDPCFLLASDKSSAATVLCAWIAECGVATGFYFWKAKNENRSKYALQFVQELAQTYGIDATARIIETVLKD